MYALLTFMLCASPALLASSLAFADNSRTNADIAFDAHFQVYLVIPLMLFRLRLSTAKHMLEEARHQQESGRLTNNAAAAVYDAGDHTAKAPTVRHWRPRRPRAVAAEQRAAEEAAAERTAPASAPKPRRG